MLNDQGEEVRKHVFTNCELSSIGHSDLDYTNTNISVITVYVTYSKEKIFYAKRKTRWVK